MRIATYNVLDPAYGDERGWAPWSVRRELVAATIAAAAPHVLALQESGWTRVVAGVTPAEDVAALTGLALVVARGGEALLVDPGAVAIVRRGAIPLQLARDVQPRACVWAELLVDGASITVGGTHLAPRDRDRVRARQAGRIARRLPRVGVRGLPLVVAGDLNSERGRAPVTPIDVLERHGFRDAFDAAIEEADASIGTLSRSRHPVRLDHVLVADGVRATVVVERVAIAAGEGGASDHRLLCSDLRLDPR